MNAKTEQRFTELQAKWREAEAAEYAYNRQLDARYHGHVYAHGLLAVERKRVESLQRRERTASDRFYAFLRTIGGRNWESGVGCTYVREHLTFADAVTTGQLAVIPPPSYGRTPSDMIAFAWPVRTDRIA